MFYDLWHQQWFTHFMLRDIIFLFILKYIIVYTFVNYSWKIFFCSPNHFSFYFLFLYYLKKFYSIRSVLHLYALFKELGIPLSHLSFNILKISFKQENYIAILPLYVDTSGAFIHTTYISCILYLTFIFLLSSCWKHKAFLCDHKFPLRLSVSAA